MKIEKNIPIPAAFKGRPTKYIELLELLKLMEVGDCLLVPTGSGPRDIHAFVRKKPGFENRKYKPHKEDAGQRVWRTA